eukprot:SAG11_NODE_26804_length_340_cov_1.286307_2_plen_82_part_01
MLTCVPLWTVEPMELASARSGTAPVAIATKGNAAKYCYAAAQVAVVIAARAVIAIIAISTRVVVATISTYRTSCPIVIPPPW